MRAWISECLTMLAEDVLVARDLRSIAPFGTEDSLLAERRATAVWSGGDDPCADLAEKRTVIDGAQRYVAAYLVACESHLVGIASLAHDLPTVAMAVFPVARAAAECAGRAWWVQSADDTEDQAARYLTAWWIDLGAEARLEGRDRDAQRRREAIVVAATRDGLAIRRNGRGDVLGFGAVPRPSPSRLMAGPLARFTESDDDDATIESISRVRRLNALTYGHAGPVLHEVQAVHSDGRIEIRPSPWLVLLAADTAQCCYRAVMSRWWGEAGLYPGPAEKWLSHVTETGARWEAVLDKLYELPDSWY